MQTWRSEEEDSADPPRLWIPHAMYPGTAFTRSIGDLGIIYQLLASTAKHHVHCSSLSPCKATGCKQTSATDLEKMGCSVQRRSVLESLVTLRC